MDQVIEPAEKKQPDQKRINRLNCWAWIFGGVAVILAILHWSGFFTFGPAEAIAKLGVWLCSKGVTYFYSCKIVDQSTVQCVISGFIYLAGFGVISFILRENAEIEAAGGYEAWREQNKIEQRRTMRYAGLLKGIQHHRNPEVQLSEVTVVETSRGIFTVKGWILEAHKGEQVYVNDVFLVIGSGRNSKEYPRVTFFP